MDAASFTPDKTGSLHPVAGIPGLTVAFVPEDLPPRWSWPPELWPLLLEAGNALASLNGVGKYLPNPELLLRPLQNREAQKSSSLEGTITEPRQQVLFEIAPRYPTSEDDPANNYREVFNYGEALRTWRKPKNICHSQSASSSSCTRCYSTESAELRLNQARFVARRIKSVGPRASSHLHTNSSRNCSVHLRDTCMRIGHSTRSLKRS